MATAARMALELTLVADDDFGGLPTEAQFREWASAPLRESGGVYSLAVRVVGEEASRELNQRYRGKNRPTNVLSFGAGVPPELAENLGFTPLGDLVLCAPVVRAEAVEQGKIETHHWAHLTIHGVLHLLGFDHQQDQEAARMEARERELLAVFGVADPYGGDGA